MDAAPAPLHAAIAGRSNDAMLRSIWDAATEQAMIATDLNGGIIGWNPGAEKLLGPTAGEMEYRANMNQFHVESSDADVAAPGEGTDFGGALGAERFAGLVASVDGDVPHVRERTYRRADGTTFPVRVTVTPRMDDDGTPAGYLFVVTDITEANEAADAKNGFVNLISHELRTPLSSIIGYLELMRDEDEVQLSASQLQFLSVAERNANRLLRLVGDLLFTAQVESGSFQLERRRVAMQPLLAASLESVSPLAATAGVIVRTGLDAPEMLVDGDPTRLGQAIDNLMSNAIKFTPRGGTVTLSLGRTETEAVVTVADTGLGIAAADMDKLFSRFFRATTATRNSVPGIGLGLTITRAIVTAHHGQMSVESAEGVGTTFSMSVPLAG